MRILLSRLALLVTGALLSCSRPAPAPATPSAPVAPAATPSPAVRTGAAAMADWTSDAPGVHRKLTLADLPEPYATASVDNGPEIVARPVGAMPKVPAGFTVELLTSDVQKPRMLRTAPNGDVFVVESEAGRV